MKSAHKLKQIKSSFQQKKNHLKRSYMEEVIHKIPNLCVYELEDSNLNKSPSRTYPIPLISTNHPIPLDNHTNMNTKSELS